ncbi:hypothetical protein [Pontibacter ramchanderi]|uniref:DUF922 domain-containing protein n=1 Tax=Pontibacter ramchanderi TaxID=1179743 RepID=A0A2N3V0T0_9BACT|nr:hypothetical protein [Pontibacter ramchanderi]PKV75215.1 hypothetical protein BD749_0153 [Pontibacter ramchanderi]
MKYFLEAKYVALVPLWLLLACVIPGKTGIAATPAVANTTPIVLRNEKLPFTPREFYIADVIDERTDKKAVAYLLPLTGVAKAQPVDLQGGGYQALRVFIDKGIPANKLLRPVVIRLKEMQVREAPAAAGRVAGSIAIEMAFETQQDGETVQLLQYKGGGRYERPIGRNEVTEPALRQSITEALRYLNTWMDREASTNPKLAKGINVTFTDYNSSSDQDTVFYNPGRPLNWNDFKADINRTSRFSATVFPSFAYEGETEVKDGIIHLHLNMKVYVLKSSSWVKDNAKDSYGLNHEQRHFDIVKLVSERFKQKIKPDELSLTDYNSNVQYHFIESFREMNRLQEQYDSETRHGLDKAAQERWNQTLDAQLKAIGAK